MLGFRPEDLEVSSGTEKHSGGLMLELKVLGVEPVGAESYVYGIIGGERVVVRVPGRSTSQTGELLRVILPKEKLHLFDAAGKRV
jgi:sn-glycerol 3-phosphate transport system ATP-binding protein